MVWTKRAVDATVSLFLRDIDGLMRRAVKERVAQALVSAGRSAGRSPGRSAGRSAGREVQARGRRARANAGRVAPTGFKSRSGARQPPIELSAQMEELTNRLLEHIERHPKQRIDEIGHALGTDPEELRIPLQVLLEEDHLVTEGEGGDIVYFAR